VQRESNLFFFENSLLTDEHSSFFGYCLYMFIIGGDPLSHLPIGQESMEVKNLFFSVAPALKGFIINRFI